MDPLTDMDSDCVENESDNCPLLYNPSQGDGDDDDVGFACDQDDSDDTIGPALAYVNRAALDDNTLWVNNVCYVVDNTETVPDGESAPATDFPVLCRVISCGDLDMLDISHPLCN